MCIRDRSGTMDAKIYLASPETCAVSAVLGYIADPSELDYQENFPKDVDFNHTDAYFIRPEDDHTKRIKETIKGKNIKPFPKASKAGDIDKKVVFKAGDGITTDDICPSNAKLLPFRSNIAYLSEYAFTTKIDDFKKRCEDMDGGVILAGENYGQGSSREHAALIPLYLGIKAVVAKSFARIHRSNLINNAILPLVFEDPADYDKIDEYDDIRIVNMKESIGKDSYILEDLTKNIKIKLKSDFSEREKQVLLEGGCLAYAKNLVLE